MRISDWSSDVCSSDLGLTAEARREIQRDLRALGHYGGSIDGSFGPGTRKAIEGYQKVAGLDATGFLPPAARARLAEPRSEERRVGKEGVRTVRTRWWPEH